MPPTNDDFANAIALTGMSGSRTFSNVGATTEAGEPPNAEGHSVWFKWTPTASTDVYVRTGTTPLPPWDSLITVFTGTNFADLVEVAQADDNDFQPGSGDPYGTSRATWTAVAGTVYWIQVTAYDDVSGPVERSDAELVWGIAPPPAPTVTSAVTLSYADSHGFAAIPSWGGPAGTVVKIRGSNLTFVTDVRFGGRAAAFTIIADNEIHATVPATRVASTTVTVSDTGGSASTAYTVLFWQPWEQPADEVLDPARGGTDFLDGTISSARSIIYADKTLAYGAGPPPYSGARDVHDVTFPHRLEAGDSVTTNQGDARDTIWRRQIMFGNVDLTPYLVSPGATSGERADPDYVTYQLEAVRDVGTLVDDVEIAYTFHVNSQEYRDDTAKDASTPADSMLGTLQLRRVPASAHTDDVLNGTDWPDPATLDAWPILAETPLIDEAPLTVVTSGAVVFLYSDYPSVAGYDASGTLTFTPAEVDNSPDDPQVWIPLLLMVSRFADGVGLTEPTRPGAHEWSGYKGAAGGAGFAGGFCSVVLSFTYRPVRYRILSRHPVRTTGWVVGAATMS